ncbi:MAG TPA: LLM class flavin-dependent oxidoreductase [Propionibacteriaceae bacterium]|nr:LLM class flavin-dependent oxidoreductase [Propionibacteriaceae bacterium]
MPQIELGLDTFGDVTVDAESRLLPQAQVLRDVIAEAELADRVGVDFFGVGEHHRPDFAISAPEVLLAAIAGRTERIRLGTAVTILSTDDPIRVYQRFSTLDAVSNGRAEVILGRGSFTESFPLFGYSLDDYNVLFEEKLAIFAALRDADRTGQPVRWKGTVRPPLDGVRVFPPVERPPLSTWVGVGGSPESVVRAARYGFPLTLAIIGGDPRRFMPYVELYHRALAQFGHDSLPLGVHSPGHIAETDAEAREELWPAYEVMRNRIGAERGWGQTNRAEFDHEIAAGSLYVGSPETVARKIAATVRALGASRFDLKYSAGTLGHKPMTRSIELYGREVIPRVRELIAQSVPATPVMVSEAKNPSDRTRRDPSLRSG